MNSFSSASDQLRETVRTLNVAVVTVYDQTVYRTYEFDGCCTYLELVLQLIVVDVIRPPLAVEVMLLDADIQKPLCSLTPNERAHTEIFWPNFMVREGLLDGR